MAKVDDGIMANDMDSKMRKVDSNRGSDLNNVMARGICLA